MRTHTKNGLLQSTHHSRTGWHITLSMSTGVCGETYTIHAYDNNLYPDSDSRSEARKETCIPMDSIEDWIALRDMLDAQIKQSNKTLRRKNK